MTEFHNLKDDNDVKDINDIGDINEKCDNRCDIHILAVGAHPDDCEMSMGGTLLKMKAMGYRTAICDLTRGEAGTYGSIETRKKELEAAAALLNLDDRMTLDLPDGGVHNSEENRLKVIEVIRTLRPELVFSFANLPLRHPDHYQCGRLVQECCYLAGLQKIKTKCPAYRPAGFIGFPELIFEKPSFVIDITEFWEKRTQLIRCYDTQVIPPGSDDSQTKTLIRSNRFWEMQEARAGMAGAMIHVRYGEPFYSDYPPQVIDPLASFRNKLR
ncbi:MAG: bacillithiol biosynthesis deacetylase BshB1 [Acidobacteria bacterium]|jgi:bacillithiol biosynthesis deacetylase BshB1|nr:bacillithiol biosynthesis deacetylase BshB1 [Acidobacteriota bacterium]